MVDYNEFKSAYSSVASKLGITMQFPIEIYNKLLELRHEDVPWTERTCLELRNFGFALGRIDASGKRIPAEIQQAIYSNKMFLEKFILSDDIGLDERVQKFTKQYLDWDQLTHPIIQAVHFDMVPQEYDYLNKVFSSVCSRLGIENAFFHQEAYEKSPENFYYEQEGAEATHWTKKAYWVLRKLLLTLDRLSEADGAKHPAEMQDVLSKIKHKVSTGDLELEIGNLDAVENHLRNAAFGDNLIQSSLFLERNNRLRINSIVLTKRCKLGCNYCSVDARAKGKEMNLELLEDLLSSEQITSNALHFGDGEVLIYKDDRLGRMIKRLITDYGLYVNITTAGLLLQNESPGRILLEELKGLGAYSKDLEITVSFNLLNPVARRSREEYIFCMQRTFEMVASLMHKGKGIKVQVMYDDSSPDTSFIATVESLEMASNGVRLRSTYRTVGPTGRAAGAYNGGGGRWGYFDCSTMSKETPQAFRVMPGGDIALHCLNPGAGGEVLGNIYENDGRQIEEAYKEFTGLFRKRMMTAKGNRCDVHRTCGIKIRPPRSQNPIAKCVANGRS